MTITLTEFLLAEHPSAEEVEAVFRPLTAGEYSNVEIAALLATMRTRGESKEDILGAARAFLDAAQPFPVAGTGILDTAGTGGDGANTINISTGASLVVAADGCPVVKCGNRSVSSKSGSADVLEELGISISLNPEQGLAQFKNSNFTFLFAPAYHPAVAHVMPVRKELKIPTIFNTLGPILSPVRPDYQLMGIAKPALGQTIAEVFQELGRKHALVVHGSGVDEIAVHGSTEFWEVTPEEIKHYELSPEELGIRQHSLDALRGGDGAENARLLKEVFAGGGVEAHRDALAVNAGAMFYLHGKAESLAAGTQHALEVLASGKVAQWLETTNG